jgi:hypothetical protein
MMKRKQFWCYALALVVGLLMSSSVYGVTFTDSFSNLDNWTLYGSPSPVQLASVHEKTDIFDNNGDATDNSGAISIQSFGLSGGFNIRSDVYLDFTDPFGCYAEAAIGIANPTLQGWVVMIPYLFSISEWERGGTIAAALRGHAYSLAVSNPYGTELSTRRAHQILPINMLMAGIVKIVVNIVPSVSTWIPY